MAGSSATREPADRSTTCQPISSDGTETLLAIADEAHHLGVDPMNRMDPSGVTPSGTEQPCAIALGLTGTPFRADNLAFCAARRVRVEEQGNWWNRFIRISPLNQEN